MQRDSNEIWEAATNTVLAFAKKVQYCEWIAFRVIVFKNDCHWIFIFWWRVASSVSVGAYFHLTWKQINMVICRNPSNLKKWRKVLLGDNKTRMVFVITGCSPRKKISICITWRPLVLNLCVWFPSQCFLDVSVMLRNVGSLSQAAVLYCTHKHTRVRSCAHTESFSDAPPNR